MLNTYVVTKDERKTYVDQSNKRLGISRTSPNSKFVHCVVGDECYEYLMSDEPFLYRGPEDTAEEKDKYAYRDHSWYSDDYPLYYRGVKVKLVHGVKVLQVKLNGDRAIIEYEDYKRTPKTLEERKSPEFHFGTSGKWRIEEGEEYV